MPVRYDQDTRTTTGKKTTAGCRTASDGALQRGMGWVMYTAAGLLSGAIAR